WRQWEFDWTPTREAYYTILARARDASGDVQPLAEEWNPSGYLWNVAPRVGVNVGTSAVVPSREASAATAPPDVFKRACRTCHQDDVVRQQRLTRAQWDREIDKMTGWGAVVDDRSALLDFLSRME